MPYDTGAKVQSGVARQSAVLIVALALVTASCGRSSERARPERVAANAGIAISEVPDERFSRMGEVTVMELEGTGRALLDSWFPEMDSPITIRRFLDRRLDDCTVLSSPDPDVEFLNVGERVEWFDGDDLLASLVPAPNILDDPEVFPGYFENYYVEDYYAATIVPTPKDPVVVIPGSAHFPAFGTVVVPDSPGGISVIGRPFSTENDLALTFEWDPEHPESDYDSEMALLMTASGVEGASSISDLTASTDGYLLTAVYCTVRNDGYFQVPQSSLLELNARGHVHLLTALSVRLNVSMTLLEGTLLRAIYAVARPVRLVS
ncbi:MAG: hypothetical protein OXN44_06160 [Acidimicrobiaceae bacterium]|nr:hypothetical protein [Acidimicrobiaceae bacterium]MDE0605626.1 hypothetical protein [Acidimicrobiaceae bacterium]